MTHGGVHVWVQIVRLSIGHLFASHDCVWQLEPACVGRPVLTRWPICYGCPSLSLSLCDGNLRRKSVANSLAFNLFNLHFFFLLTFLVNPTPLFSFTKVWCCESVEAKLGSRPERRTPPCNGNAPLDNNTGHRVFNGQTFMSLKQVLYTSVISISMGVDHCKSPWFKPHVQLNLCNPL